MEMNNTIYIINGEFINKFESEIDLADDECSDIELKNKIKKLSSPIPFNLSSKTNTKTTINKSNDKFNSSKNNHSTTLKYISNGRIIKARITKSKYSLNDKYNRNVIKKTRITRSNNNKTFSKFKQVKEEINTPSVYSKKTSTSKIITSLNKTTIYKSKQYKSTKLNK